MCKKIYNVIILALIMIFTFTACGEIDIKIEDHIWNLVTVQSTENNGAIIAYNPNFNLEDYEGVTVIEISLSAENGKLTINDKVNNATYDGTYTVTDNSFKSMIFTVSVGEKEGTAVLSDTYYKDDKTFSTLILSIDDYILTFQATL